MHPPMIFGRCLAVVAMGAALCLSGCKPAAKPAGTAPVAAASSGQYTPQLTPRFTAGESFAYHATASLDNDMRVIVLQQQDAAAGNATDGKAAGNSTPQVTENVVKQTHESYAVELVADGLAKTVYPNGTLREVAYLVHECEIIHPDGKSEVLAPAGSVLGARRQDDGRLAFAINGQPPAAQTAQNLGFVAQLGEPGATDDELLGPGNRVAVGATWPVNEPVLLKSAFAQAYPGAEKAVGKFQLETVRPDSTGHLATTVSGGFSLEGMRPPFPPQVEALPSVVNYQMTISAPVDAVAGIYDADLKTLTHHQGRSGSMQYSINHSEGHFDINIALEQHARYTFDPNLKPSPALLNAPPIPELPPPTAQTQAGARMIQPDPIPDKPAKKAAPGGPQQPAAVPATLSAPKAKPSPPPPQSPPNYWGGAEPVQSQR
jgi:hypothetical protein